MNVYKNFSSPSKEWVEGILKCNRVTTLRMEEFEVSKKLEIDRNFPILDSHEVLELRRKKIIIQARIRQIIDKSLNSIKEMF